MRPVHHLQNTAFLAAFALLFSAAYGRDPFEAQAPMNRSSRIEPFEAYPGVVNASHDSGNANRSSYGFRIRTYLSQSEGNNVPAEISGSAIDHPTPVAIIDGHPHNPSTMLVQRLSLCFTRVV
jgi:hypothetical protein